MTSPNYNHLLGLSEEKLSEMLKEMDQEELDKVAIWAGTKGANSHNTDREAGSGARTAKEAENDINQSETYQKIYKAAMLESLERD